MQFKLNTLALSAAIAAGSLVMTCRPVMATGGHFLVDDADITPAGECALETWFQHASAGPSTGVDRVRSEHAWLAVPICSTDSGWEVSLPFAYNTRNNELSAYALELKSMLSTNLHGGALALSFGVVRDHQAGELAGGFINLPYSYPVNDTVTLHLNIGTDYNRLDSEWNPTWGVATAMTIHDRLDLIAETAGAGSDSPAAALGFRTVLTNRMELDASVGRDFELRSNLISIGLNLTF